MPARACEICNERPAVLVCQHCGAVVCTSCSREALCTNCSQKLGNTVAGGPALPLWRQFLLPLAVSMILAGVVLVFLGSAKTSSSVDSCFFWPFPLIVSCDEEASSTFPIVFSILTIGFLAVSALLWLKAWSKSSAPPQ